MLQCKDFHGVGCLSYVRLFLMISLTGLYHHFFFSNIFHPQDGTDQSTLKNDMHGTGSHVLDCLRKRIVQKP